MSSVSFSHFPDEGKSVILIHLKSFPTPNHYFMNTTLTMKTRNRERGKVFLSWLTSYFSWMLFLVNVCRCIQANIWQKQVNFFVTVWNGGESRRQIILLNTGENLWIYGQRKKIKIKFKYIHKFISYKSMNRCSPKHSNDKNQRRCMFIIETLQFIYNCTT